MSIKNLLGKNIRKYRKLNNLSQEKLAELVDLNPRQIVRLENGESFPSAESMEKIAKSLNVGVYDLFYNDNCNDVEYVKSYIRENIDKLPLDRLKLIYDIVKNK